MSYRIMYLVYMNNKHYLFIFFTYYIRTMKCAYLQIFVTYAQAYAQCNKIHAQPLNGQVHVGVWPAVQRSNKFDCIPRDKVETLDMEHGMLTRTYLSLTSFVLLSCANRYNHGMNFSSLPSTCSELLTANNNYRIISM